MSRHVHTATHVAVACCCLAILASRAQAQNEATLRAALEGKTVTVKVDMPATSKGIDLFPQAAMPVNWREMADRMKDNGTALKPGQTVMITKVVVKKDSHIEVQLGGGGYGTFGDQMTNSSAVSANTQSETALERQLRDSIKTTTNATRKKQFEKDLASARSARERENSKSEAEAAQANQAREANLRVKRAESGSRFNIRYKNGIPADAMTPAGVMKTLAPYAEFAGGPTAAETAKAASPGAAPPARTDAGANGMLALKKGLSVAEVEALLGPANTASEVKEGSMTVMKRNYIYDGKRIAASFVGGILVDYAITPL